MNEIAIINNHLPESNYPEDFKNISAVVIGAKVFDLKIYFLNGHTKFNDKDSYEVITVFEDNQTHDFSSSNKIEFRAQVYVTDDNQLDSPISSNLENASMKKFNESEFYKNPRVLTTWVLDTEFINNKSKILITVSIKEPTSEKINYYTSSVIVNLDRTKFLNFQNGLIEDKNYFTELAMTYNKDTDSYDEDFHSLVSFRIYYEFQAKPNLLDFNLVINWSLFEWKVEERKHLNKIVLKLLKIFIIQVIVKLSLKQKLI
ncbi:hypothetical protein SCLARK_00432 [Spiroplasma clarkii]|uniref:hypothetical protein n=1 Tax=Spiroplasma clarkii TaxID=2139 RepID=UPI000B5850B7|nr:hypothetical protein [Spiroplasma clarkii]ARU91154.1 hypothetical protein SCLARK_00432 [Spiroplasma clarkii]